MKGKLRALDEAEAALEECRAGCCENLELARRIVAVRDARVAVVEEARRVAETAGEPVDWRYRYKTADGDWSAWWYCGNEATMNAEAQEWRDRGRLVETAILCATPSSADAWVSFDQRAPSVEDCDERGDVMVLRSGRAMLWRVKPERPVDATHWRPTMESALADYQRIAEAHYSRETARVPDGFVPVPLAALLEVLRISDRRHDSWDAVKRAIASATPQAPTALLHQMHGRAYRAAPQVAPETKGCRARLAPGQHWAFCGETDMGQTSPALCERCGGSFKRAAEAAQGDR